eukprot:1160111-Pelagomonas_calceolata.AAC.12
MQPVPDSVAGPLSQHLSKLEPDSSCQGHVFQWALVDCAEADRRQQSAQGERMDEVVLLLSQQYGPFVMRQVRRHGCGEEEHELGKDACCCCCLDLPWAPVYATGVLGLTHDAEE